MTTQIDNASKQSCSLMKPWTSITKAGASMGGVNEPPCRRSPKSQLKKPQALQDIDEIAFQTNLLGPHAAVEAARAGKRGAGLPLSR